MHRVKSALLGLAIGASVHALGQGLAFGSVTLYELADGRSDFLGSNNFGWVAFSALLGAAYGAPTGALFGTIIGACRTNALLSSALGTAGGLFVAASMIDGNLYAGDRINMVVLLLGIVSVLAGALAGLLTARWTAPVAPPQLQL